MNNHSKNNKIKITPTLKRETSASGLWSIVKLVDYFENRTYSFTKQIVLPSCFISAQQNRWVLVGNDVNGTSFYLEKNSRQFIGSISRVWSKTVFADGSYRISQLDWECGEKKYTTIEASK